LTPAGNDLLSREKAKIAMDKSQNIGVRDKIFYGIAEKMITACIIADEEGIIAETDAVAKEAKRLGLLLESIVEAGMQVRAGDVLARFRGTPQQIAAAEEVLIGLMAKPSGIATAMHEFVRKAGRRPRIVCGAWKKMPPQLKGAIRRAIVAGGGSFRIIPEPFIYLDKNYVEMLGGVEGCLEAASGMNGLMRVVQLKGRYKDIAREACEAARCGAAVVFIDTGLREDIGRVSAALSQLGLRKSVRIAFAGNIKLEDIEGLKSMDVDILDIGRAIVDAPLLDMRLEVIGWRQEPGNKDKGVNDDI
jgi:nicotinate-nucleotide pyrophosphorylase (carboxylating)